jgi:hypothetical protein
MFYLGLGIGDFGEPFWIHGVGLLVLLTLSWRLGRRSNTARPGHGV